MKGAALITTRNCNNMITDYVNRTYTPLWNKYRPAILKMMVDAANSPQEYKLYGHEFRAMDDKKKSGFDFVLQLSKGRAINDIKKSTIAQDLLNVLQNSRKAVELADADRYEFAMDRKFVLKVTRMPEPAPAAAE